MVNFFWEPCVLKIIALRGARRARGMRVSFRVAGRKSYLPFTRTRGFFPFLISLSLMQTTVSQVMSNALRSGSSSVCHTAIHVVDSDRPNLFIGLTQCQDNIPAVHLLGLLLKQIPDFVPA